MLTAAPKHDSQTHTNLQNERISISDYSKISWLAMYWISFECKFQLVASSQGFEYILQDEEFDPVDENEKTNYNLDLTFIYDDFQNRNGQMP